MHLLSSEQYARIIEIVVENHGGAVSQSRFCDCVLSLIEDVPGLEVIPPDEADCLVDTLWELHMTEKKKAVPTLGDQSQASKPIFDETALGQAIAVGAEKIKAGASKTEASRAMFALINLAPKDVVVKAFIDGCGLTEKGALTYWYNCRRHMAKNQSTKAKAD